MLQIRVVRRTVLADVRRLRDHRSSSASASARPIATRVGLSALDVLPTTVSPKSPEETLDAIDEALATFNHDVAIDACPETYGDECVGTDPEVDKVAACIRSLESHGEVVDGASALTCAGVDPSPANLVKFAECVRKRESSSRVPRGTLAYCAIVIRRGVAAGTAHTTIKWRNDLETWSRQFRIFLDKWRIGAAGEVGVVSSATGPSVSDMKPWADQYNAARARFIAQGGHTSAPEIDVPSGFLWGWLTVGVLVIVGVVVFRQVVPLLRAP